jgi:hypothetical protein
MWINLRQLPPRSQCRTFREMSLLVRVAGDSERPSAPVCLEETKHARAPARHPTIALGRITAKVARLSLDS